VSSLRRGHANLLCIVPILVYVLPKQARTERFEECYLLPGPPGMCFSDGKWINPFI